MSSEARQPYKRLVIIVSILLALVFSPISLFWYWNATPHNPDEMYPFLGASFIALAFGTVALLMTRSKWRWMLLVLVLPVSLVFCERAWNLWSWSYQKGIFPYFLFLIPPALASFSLWTLIRKFTKERRKAVGGAVSWQQVCLSLLHALPFALVFAPTWLARDDFSFLVPSSCFMFIPGFGGVFEGRFADKRGILIATISLGASWVLLASVFLSLRPRRLVGDSDNSSKD